MVPSDGQTYWWMDTHRLEARHSYSCRFHSSSCECGLGWEAASWCVFLSVSQLQLCVWSWVRGGFLMCVLVSVTASDVRVVLGERRLPVVCSCQCHSSSCACGPGWEASSWCVFLSVSQFQLCVWFWVRGGFLFYVKVHNLRVNHIRRSQREREIFKHITIFCVDRCQSSSVTHHCQLSLRSLN